jgi:uncharacterized membrane protein SpoIIM required for sporulation
VIISLSNDKDRATRPAFPSPRVLRLVATGFYVAALATGAWIAPFHLGGRPAPVHVPLVITTLHNLRVVAILVVGGGALFIPTLIVGAFNGFLTGALLASVARYPAWIVAILTHGTPEVAAQWCAMSAGAELCVWVLVTLKHGNLTLPRAAVWWTSAAIALTGVAAIIEAYLTPLIVTNLS